MGKTLNRFKFILIPYFILVIAVFVTGLVKVDYTLVAPAYNDNVNETIFVPSDNVVEGSFHTTSVISLDEVTYLQFLLATNMKTVTVEEQPEYFDYVNTRDFKVMNVLMKDDSIQTSLIVGIDHSEIDITYFSYQTVYLTYKHLTDDSLIVGDYIVSINDNTDLDEVVDTIACGVKASFKIIRDDEEMIVEASKNEVGDNCTFGIYLKPYSEIIETASTFRIYDTLTGGPSGGLMQSLYVFNQLSVPDYSLGLKIGGTGTIDVEGNVGYIGGMRQKIITAIGNDIDIFFAPHLNDNANDNYIEALATLEEFNTDMILVGVATFDEAVEYLQGHGDFNE